MADILESPFGVYYLIFAVMLPISSPEPAIPLYCVGETEYRGIAGSGDEIVMLRAAYMASAAEPIIFIF